MYVMICCKRALLLKMCDRYELFQSYRKLLCRDSDKKYNEVLLQLNELVVQVTQYRVPFKTIVNYFDVKLNQCNVLIVFNTERDVKTYRCESKDLIVYGKVNLLFY